MVWNPFICTASFCFCFGFFVFVFLCFVLFFLISKLLQIILILLFSSAISMVSEPNPPKTLTARHKCSACFKQYKKKEHLVEHEDLIPLESLREHLAGPHSQKGVVQRSLKTKVVAFVWTFLIARLALFSTLEVVNYQRRLISLGQHLGSCKPPAPSPPPPRKYPFQDLKVILHQIATSKLMTDFDVLRGMYRTKAESGTSSRRLHTWFWSGWWWNWWPHCDARNVMQGIWNWRFIFKQEWPHGLWSNYCWLWNGLWWRKRQLS